MVRCCERKGGSGSAAAPYSSSADWLWLPCAQPPSLSPAPLFVSFVLTTMVIRLPVSYRRQRRAVTPRPGSSCCSFRGGTTERRAATKAGSTGVKRHGASAGRRRYRCHTHTPASCLFLPVLPYISLADISFTRHLLPVSHFLLWSLCRCSLICSFIPLCLRFCSSDNITVLPFSLLTCGLHHTCCSVHTTYSSPTISLALVLSPRLVPATVIWFDRGA